MTETITEKPPLEALLKVENLSIGIRRYTKASSSMLLSSVEDISFEIYPGEILGIVGESGSGKSLTALSIPGLLGDNKEVSSGSILFGEEKRNLLTLTEKELQKIRGKDISMIFQEPFSSLNPLIKAGEQIAETLFLHGSRDRVKNKSLVIELLKKLKMPRPEKIYDTYPHRLSGGMCQRIMIAMAVICRPRLLIADEPTTALDINTQSEIISLLKEINSDFGTSILFISHDLSVIKNLCSRILVMYSGRFLEEGSVDEIFNNPAHEYTKSLIGAIPNRVSRGKALTVISGRIPSLEEGRPQGCPFHPRCARAISLCKGKFLPKLSINPKHKTHCILGVE